jgi:hypothetical protein
LVVSARRAVNGPVIEQLKRIAQVTRLKGEAASGDEIGSGRR